MADWNAAYHEFMANVMPVLEQHGRMIGAAAHEGDPLAVEVMKHYQLLSRSFDHLTAQLVERALNDWLKANSESLEKEQSNDSSQG